MFEKKNSITIHPIDDGTLGRKRETVRVKYDLLVYCVGFRGGGDLCVYESMIA